MFVAWLRGVLCGGLGADWAQPPRSSAGLRLFATHSTTLDRGWWQVAGRASPRRKPNPPPLARLLPTVGKQSQRARKGRDAKLERLILASSDMSDVAAAARLLRRGADELRFRERRAMETGMFTSYARAFNKSKGNPPLPAAPTSGLSPEERATHGWALGERDKVWAHVDRDGHRRETSGVTGTDGNVALTEEWNPPTPAQLDDLSALAEKLSERYRDDAVELWRKLQEDESGSR